MRSWSRRKFLGNSAKAAAGTAAALAGLRGPAGASAAQTKKAAPNDKVHIALIGCGGMGTGDLADFLRLPEVECLALCDVDQHRLDETVQTVKELRGRAPDGYRDFRKVLDREDVHAVIVATPDHWHALPTILACQAGKDVYVEKPLATSIAEGRAMVAAARKYGRVVQVGTQQRSAPHFKDAVDFVKSGELGRIRFVRAWAYLDWKGSIGNPEDRLPPSYVDYDLWLGPAPRRPFNPMRFHHNFRWFWDYSGGLATDWGAHMIDVVRWAMDEQPTGASAVGGKFGFPDDIRETPDTLQAVLEFPGFSMVWEHMIGCGVGPWQREHGCEFHGQNGIAVVDRDGWEVVSETDMFQQPDRVFRMMPRPRQSASDDGHLAHVRDFVDGLKTRERPKADVEIGHLSAIPSHLVNISWRLKRSVKWDPAAERCVGDAEAQALVGRKYREPWVLPKS